MNIPPIERDIESYCGFHNVQMHLNEEPIRSTTRRWVKTFKTKNYYDYDYY